MPYVRKYPPAFLIDRILPISEVHLLTGPSGAGKTTLWAQIAQDWSRGLPVWGYKSRPCPWVYIALDRSMSETEDRLLAAGLDLSTLEFHSLDERETINISTHIAPLVRPEHKLVMIEASQRLLSEKGEGNDYSSVAKLMARLKKWARPAGKAVLLSAHDAKSKEGEGYSNARERVAGSVAWGGTSSTVFNLSITGPETRTLTVTSRYAPSFSRNYIMGEEGRLLDITDTAGTSSDTLLALIAQLPSGSSIEYSYLERVAESLDLSTRTTRRVIATAVTSGLLFRESKEGQPGLYTRTQNTMN